MDETDSALVRQCQAGNKDAFGALVKRHAPRAVGTAALLLGNHDDALDASQQAFVRAWRSIKRFDGRASFYTWYSTILRNVCISLYRRRSRRKAVELPDNHPEPRPWADPELLAQKNEQARRIWRAIQQLPIKHREVIVMSHFQHLAYKEIAASLEVPIGTVMSRLHAARKSLREKLTGEEP